MGQIDRKKWIESPKVIHHPEWLKRWRKDPFSVPPIYVEISPVGHCNHRCSFCAPEVLGYVERSLSVEVLGRCFQEMRQIREEDPDGLGFKSVQFAGEGEPALHRNLAEICKLARGAGIDVGLLTNGTPFTGDSIKKIVPLINGYFQLSINAGKAETYARIHRAPLEHWDIVWRNVERVVRAKEELGAIECDIGINMTLLTKEVLETGGNIIPANWQEAETLVKRARDAGVNYIAIKPYRQDAYSEKTARRYGDMSYGKVLGEIFEMGNELIRKYSSPSFEVVFRFSRFEEYEEVNRGYQVCLATPTLWSYIQSGGLWLSCSIQWTNPDFVLGNIYTDSVKEIWYGQRRREHHNFVLHELDICRVCKKTCHPDKENRYLTRIKEMTDEEFRQELERIKGIPATKRANFI